MKRAGLLAPLALALALCAVARAQSVPESGRLDFVVERDGDRIGSHRFAFARDDDALRIETTVEVAVGLAFITLYRFRKTAVETWRDGRLVAYRARTDDDGTIITARVTAGPDGLVLEGPWGRGTAPLGTMVSGYWNAATVTQTALIDSEDARLVPIAVSGGAPETLTVNGVAVPTRRYRLTGALARELWYGRDGLLVKMTAIASDGSEIVTVRR